MSRDNAANLPGAGTRNPTLNELPPPALVGIGGAIYAALRAGQDGTPVLVLTVRNAVLSMDAVCSAEDVDKLISRLQGMRRDMPGGLAVTSQMPNGRH